MTSTAINNFLRLTDEFERAAGVRRVTLSYRIFKDSKKLKLLHEGADIQTGRLEDAIGYLSANWPEGAVWPDDLPRPIPPEDRQPATAALAQA